MEQEGSHSTMFQVKFLWRSGECKRTSWYGVWCMVVHMRVVCGVTRCVCACECTVVFYHILASRALSLMNPLLSHTIHHTKYPTHYSWSHTMHHAPRTALISWPCTTPHHAHTHTDCVNVLCGVWRVHEYGVKCLAMSSVWYLNSARCVKRCVRARVCLEYWVRGVWDMVYQCDYDNTCERFSSSVI